MAERGKLLFHDILVQPDPSRTVVRPFEPGYPRGFDGGGTCPMMSVVTTMAISTITVVISPLAIVIALILIVDITIGALGRIVDTL